MLLVELVVFLYITEVVQKPVLKGLSKSHHHWALRTLRHIVIISSNIMGVAMRDDRNLAASQEPRRPMMKMFLTSVMVALIMTRMTGMLTTRLF